MRSRNAGIDNCPATRLAGELNHIFRAGVRHHLFVRQPAAPPAVAELRLILSAGPRREETAEAS
jgi:hypothetical protein